MHFYFYKNALNIQLFTVFDAKFANMAIILGKVLSFTVLFASFLAWNYVTQAQKASKDIPSLKLSKLAGPTLTFLFW